MKTIATLAVAVIFYCAHLNNSFAQPLNKKDSLILVEFYHATNGPLWFDQGLWLRADVPVSRWGYITVRNGRVEELNMAFNNVRGQLPAALGGLDSLRMLDLSFNPIGGTLPPELGRLSRVVFLYLVFTELEGSIPVSFGDLSSLTALFMNDNHLSGPIPATFSKLRNLKYLLLGNNQLSGPLPLLQGATKLEDLFLWANRFSGHIPADYGKFRMIRSLSLGQNQLSGSIPPELAKLDTCSLLSLEENQLAGIIPPELGTMKSLTTLNLSHNQIQGNIPASLGNLPILQNLYLSYNRLSGPVPGNLGEPPFLHTVDLQHNQLSGPVPVSLARSRIRQLELLNNRFTFDGLEHLRDSVPNANYEPQATLPLKHWGPLLAINAGGTLCNNTYQWFRNGTALSPITGNPIFLATAPGDYRVQITNKTVPALTLQSTTWHVRFGVALPPYWKPALTSLAKGAASLPFILYPNPAQNQTYMRIVLDKADGMLDISITDMQQRVVWQKRIAAVNEQSLIPIAVSSLTNGVYVITVRNGAMQGSQQLVKTGGY